MKFRDDVLSRIHRRIWHGAPYVWACRAEGVSERSAREWRRRGESDMPDDAAYYVFWSECRHAEAMCRLARARGIDVTVENWNCVWDADREPVTAWEAYDGAGQLKPWLRIATMGEIREKAREEFGDECEF